MKCIYCKKEIESDDNFCFNCGHWTPKGYEHFKEHPDYLELLEGNTIKLQEKIALFFTSLTLLVILFLIITIIRGQDIYKPFIYIKKQIINYQYGYNTTIIKTDNQYSRLDINNIEQSNKIIEEDLSTQNWQCTNKDETYKIYENLKQKYKIYGISLCDINIEKINKIQDVITDMYNLFPTSIGYLNTITITNTKNKDEFIASFQPIYIFVNNNINDTNKVNKTQILLNSYYYLNSKDINNIVGDNYYVKDATLESLIAHEMGHYLVFVTILKENNLNNFTLINKNYNYKEIINIINSNKYSNQIVDYAYKNYNNKYKNNLEINKLASSISKYAGEIEIDNQINSNELIAEAVHDYYLHKDNANKFSLEIISILKKKLGDYN